MKQLVDRERIMALVVGNRVVVDYWWRNCCSGISGGCTPHTPAHSSIPIPLSSSTSSPSTHPLHPVVLFFYHLTLFLSLIPNHRVPALIPPPPPYLYQATHRTIFLSWSFLSILMSATATAVSAAEKPVRRFPPPCWTQDEALALIQAYRERWYALRRGYLRTADWDAVAEEVGRLCPGAVPPKTSAQCRHKMEKLRQRYRAEKQRALSFPGGQFLSTWFYFEAMDSMEKNGSGSNPDEETQSGNDLNFSGMKIVNSKKTHQSNSNIDSIYGGLNPGRGIRFKPVAADNNLVTVASRSNSFRVSQNYDAQEEDNDNDDELEDEYFVEPPIVKNSGKPHRSSSQNYATRFQSDHHTNNGVHVLPLNFQAPQNSGTRPRKFSKTASNSNPSYWNENGEDDDNDHGEDEVWVKMPKDRDFRDKYGDRNSTHHYFNGEDDFSREKRGVKRDNNNSIGQIVSSIKVLADGFVKVEKMKMDMIHEIEKTRMEAEMKRSELLLESQKQIVEAFVKGLADNNRKQQQ